MASLVSIIVSVVEHTWDLSIVVMPALFITLFAYYLIQQDEQTDVVAAFTAGQRDVILAYSPYLIGGFVLGGAVNYLLGGATVPGAVAVAGALGYAMLHQDVPEPIKSQDVSAYLHHAFWALVLTGSITVIVLLAGTTFMVITTSTGLSWGIELTQHVLAVVFYAVVFWEL